MVRMTDIWDRTTQVLRGRASMLAAIAALLIFLPKAIQAAAQLYALHGATSVTGVAGAAAGVGLLSLLLSVISMWGNAAIVAAGSDPAYDRGAAVALGARRLGPVIGVTLLLGLAALLLFLPVVLLLASSLSVLQLMSLAHGQVPVGGAVPAVGAVLAALVYALVVLVAVVFIAVRLALLVPVIVNERLGVGAIGRAWWLTKGLFWRLFGALLLFGIVFLVATTATTSLLGLVAGLLLGTEHAATATFVAQLGGAAVTAAYAVVTGVFTAQLYRALTGREAAETFA